MSNFPFEVGDNVLVRIRDGGALYVEFIAVCDDISTYRFMSDKALFDLPLDGRSIVLRESEAEFEIVDDDAHL